MKNKEFINYGIIVFLVIFSMYIIFNNLGSSTFFDWDEAHYGEVALEILKTNEWIVLNYAGEPDLISKPPLGYWLIAISFSIFGVNEFALRFWSALFGVGTILLVYFFGQQIKNKCVGLYSALFLLATGGFVGYHGARTGDFDVIAAFFITLSLFSFYLSQERGNGIFLVGTSVSMALAVLVKGVVGLFPLMIIVIFLLYSGSLKKTIMTKEVGYSIFSFLILVLPWLIYRFLRGGEYFATLIDYDLLKRLAEPAEGHVGDWSFYFMVLLQTFGPIFFLLILLIFVYSVFLMNRKDRAISLLVIWISLIMVVFTAAKTKIFWYIIPLYPALSLLIGFNLNSLQEHFKINRILFMLGFLIVMIIPFSSVMTTTQSIRETYQMSIKDLEPELKDINVIYVHSDEIRQSCFLYLNSYVKENVKVYNNIQDINATPGDGIITFHQERYDFLVNTKDYELVRMNRFAALFKKI